MGRVVHRDAKLPRGWTMLVIYMLSLRSTPAMLYSLLMHLEFYK